MVIPEQPAGRPVPTPREIGTPFDGSILGACGTDALARKGLDLLAERLLVGVGSRCMGEYVDRAPCALSPEPQALSPEPMVHDLGSS